MHLHQVQGFSDIFIDFVEKKFVNNNVPPRFGHRIHNEKMLQSNRRRQHSLHIEKVGDNLGNELVKMGYAVKQDSSWYLMDDQVANCFMTYLAIILGNLGDINATPVTNNSRCIASLGQSSLARHGKRPLNIDKIRTRNVFLETLIPVPQGEVDISEISKFKSKYSDKLRDFRNYIEHSCIEIENIANLDARSDCMEFFKLNAKAKVTEISDAMKTNWGKITFTRIIPLIAASAGVSATIPSLQPISTYATAGLSLMSAIYSCVSQSVDRPDLEGHPLGYAALVQRHLIHH